MYLIGHSRSCRPQGTLYCGTLSAWATLLSSSCSAPNGQSQPQNGPRPQNSSPAAIDGPEDEDQRRREEVFPTEAGQQRVGEGQDVDDGKLRVRVPAQPDENEQQIAAADPRVDRRPTDQEVLEEEDQR